MNISVRPYSDNDAKAWDDFCKGALQATLLHTRSFLSYHKERFEDRSLIIVDEEKWLGLFPAALSLANEKFVVSHPGVTYGGLIHHGKLRGEKMIAALGAIRSHYATQGCTNLIYKLIPPFYHKAPAQDDSYALFRLGAVRTRCDLSSTIDLQNRLPVSSRRRRGLKKAIKAGVEIVAGHHCLAAFWKVLQDNLERKHGSEPVHNLEEIVLLAQRFPGNIRCLCAVEKDTVLAGVLLFITPTTYHAQYIASSQAGYECSALDMVFESAILAAQRESMRWFNFGISSENGGTLLNEGLFQFKAEFGAGSTVHEFFELDLIGDQHAVI